MPEFHLVEHPTIGPTQCAFCSDFEGPFIDTCIEGDFGRVYVCAPNARRSGCASQIAHALGWVSPEQMAQADAQVSEMIRELTDQLNTANMAKAAESGTEIARIEMGELEGFFNWKRAKEYREKKREKRQLEEAEV